MGDDTASFSPPPVLGLVGENLCTRDSEMVSTKHKAYFVEHNGYFFLWENSNFPNEGLYYGAVTTSLSSDFPTEEDTFFPDVLSLKCWVLEKMEEYSAKTPRTSVGVS